MLDKYDYYDQRADDPSLSQKQREYAQNFLTGIMCVNTTYFREKGSINRTAYDRGQKWRKERDEIPPP